MSKRANRMSKVTPPRSGATRARKGNHPSNPYAEQSRDLPRLADREGWPFAKPRAKRVDLTDEAQLGPSSPPADAEPTFTLRASDPLGGMMVRFWANANMQALPRESASARALAARMDAWREGRK